MMSFLLAKQYFHMKLYLQYFSLFKPNSIQLITNLKEETTIYIPKLIKIPFSI